MRNCINPPGYCDSIEFKRQWDRKRPSEPARPDGVRRYVARTTRSGFTKANSPPRYTVRMWRDVAYALRTLRKNPAFTATALAALAIGIGADTAIFSVVDTVLLKPFGYPQPGRVVLFYQVSPAGPMYGGSATRFNVWRGQNNLFQDVSAYEYSGAGLNLAGGIRPEQVHVLRVSESYFRLLGAPIAAGRTFTGEEDRPGGGHVAVLNYGFWQRHFGGNPRIVDRTISLGGVPYNVIGIVGPGFQTGLDAPPDLWLPFQIDPNSADNAMYFSVIARLRPGVSIASANARLDPAAAEFRRRFPALMGPRDRFAVRQYGDAIVSDVRSSLLVLAGAVRS